MRFYLAIGAFLLVAFPYALAEAGSSTGTCDQPIGSTAPSIKEFQQVLGAMACPSPSERDRQRAQLLYDRLSTGASLDQTNATIAGLQLRGTQEELQMAQEILGIQPPFGWQKRASQCFDVKCAIIQAFGNEESALRAMNLYKRFGYAFSVSQEENIPGHEVVWSAVQLRKIEKVLEVMPSTFHHMKALKQIKLVSAESVAEVTRRRKTVDDFTGLMVFDESAILIKDDTHDPYNNIWNEVDHTFSHELGHAFDANFGVSVASRFHDSSHFSDLSRWKRVSSSGSAGSFTFDQSAGFASKYATSNPDEDFAESVANYVFGAIAFKEHSSSKYEFLKNMAFGGREYLRFGVKAWPELNRKISEQGGCSALIGKCLNQMGPLFLYKGNAWFRDQDSTRGMSPEDFPYKTGCYHEAAKTLAKQVEETEGFCSYDGVVGVEEHVRSLCAPELWQLVSLGNQFVTDSKKSPAAQCLARRDFTSKCYAEATQAALGVSKTDQTQAGPSMDQLKQIFGLSAGAFFSNSSNPIFQIVSPGQIAASCLGTLVSISADASKKGFVYTSNKSSISDPTFLRGCAIESNRLLNSQGIQIDNIANSEGILQNAATKEAIESFSREAYKGYEVGAASCSVDPKCKARVAQDLLNRWAQKYRITLDSELNTTLAGLIVH